jgi:hydrogenase nickel incorporation protein HypA/HybF
MHEFSIVEALFRSLEDIIERERLRSVERVRVRVGELRQIVPELMTFAFDAAKEETKACGAALELETVAARFRCETCGNECSSPETGYACPHCGSYELSVVQGKEIEIAAIEGERE